MLATRLTDEERRVILNLCRDARDEGAEEDLIEGFLGNHLDADGELLADLRAAAAGDVAATARLRTRCGLPLIV